MNPNDALSMATWESFTCAEPPPACSFAAITDLTLDGRDVINTIVKADATFRRTWGITSAIKPSGTGTTKGTIAVAGLATLVYGDSSVAVDDILGPKPDSWLGWKGYPCGWRVIKVLSTSHKLALVRYVPSQVDKFLAKPTGTITKGSTGTFNIWAGTPHASAAVVTGWQITGVHNFSTTITSTTKFCYVEYLNGLPVGSPAEC